MKESFTFETEKKKRCDNKADRKGQHLLPSEKTLALLKLFARNYQVEKSMPKGLQEMILG